MVAWMGGSMVEVIVGSSLNRGQLKLLSIQFFVKLNTSFTIRCLLRMCVPSSSTIEIIWPFPKCCFCLACFRLLLFSMASLICFSSYLRMSSFIFRRIALQISEYSMLSVGVPFLFICLRFSLSRLVPVDSSSYVSLWHLSISLSVAPFGAIHVHRLFSHFLKKSIHNLKFMPISKLHWHIFSPVSCAFTIWTCACSPDFIRTYLSIEVSHQNIVACFAVYDDIVDFLIYLLYLFTRIPGRG